MYICMYVCMYVRACAVFFLLQNKQWDRAMMLFDEMVAAPPEDKLVPNQFTYNALISVLTHSGCLELAALKFREMQEVNEEFCRVFVSPVHTTDTTDRWQAPERRYFRDLRNKQIFWKMAQRYRYIKYRD